MQREVGGWETGQGVAQVTRSPQVRAYVLLEFRTSLGEAARLLPVTHTPSTSRRRAPRPWLLSRKCPRGRASSSTRKEP